MIPTAFGLKILLDIEVEYVLHRAPKSFAKVSVDGLWSSTCLQKI